MGCSSSNEEDKLSSFKRKLISQIEFNKTKLNIANQRLTKIQMEISQLETDIRLNHTEMSEIEQKNKARKIAELKKDEIRQKNIVNNLTTLNDTMKNNLQMMEMKIEEYRNAKSIEEANSILNQIYKMDFGKTYNKNVETLLKVKQQDDDNMRGLEAGNKLYLSGNGNIVESPEDILNNLLRQGPAPV